MAKTTREITDEEAVTWLRNKRDSSTGGERSKRILSHIIRRLALRAPASEGEAVTSKGDHTDLAWNAVLARSAHYSMPECNMGGPPAECPRCTAIARRTLDSLREVGQLATHPAPVAATVTEAMVQAFAHAWDGQKQIEKNNHERIRVALTAALGGAR